MFPAAFSSPRRAVQMFPAVTRRKAATADVQIKAIPDSTAGKWTS
jgi:hypothetical protein